MIALLLFRNPRIMFLLISVILVAGASAIAIMPRLEDPILGRRVGVISTVFPGAAAARVESLVTIKLEQQLRGISEIDQIRSTSRAGISNLLVELRDNVYEVDPIWSKVRDRLSRVQTDLPEGCRSPEFEVFPMKAFAAILAVKPRSRNIDVSILRRLSNQLAIRIGNLSGTEDVGIFGDPGEEFVAEIQPVTLAGIRLPTAAIASQILADNAKQSAGILPGSAPLLLEVQGEENDTLRSLEDSIVRLPGGQPVSLSEIATVTKENAAPLKEFALSDDAPRTIVIGAHVDDRIRVDQWARKLRATIRRFENEYRAEVEVDTICAQDEFVAARLESLLQSLLLGGIAVVFVVFVLMGWRSMIVVGASLPLSAALVFAGLRAMHIPLHQMSITGLIVALGLLIDNAIVVVDEVRSRVAKGMSAENAIAESINHLKMPLFGSTLTTALAFMPIATLPGPPGEFVGTIAVSVIVAIGSSFLLAMTVVPAMLAVFHIDSGSRSLLDRGLTIRPLARFYRATLSTVFRIPALGILTGIALPIAGYTVANQLPEQFFPPSDRNQIQIEVELPASESIESTLQTVRRMNEFVGDHESVETVYWFGGRSAPTFYYNVVPRRRGTPFYAQAIVSLRKGSSAPDAVRAMQRRLDERHPECRVVVRQLEQGPPFDAPIELRIVGPDLSTLQELGNQLRLLLSQTDYVIHTRSDTGETIPKLALHVSGEASALTGISQTDVTQFLYTTIEGAPAGEILDGDERLPFKIRMARSASVDRLDRLAALPISSANHSRQQDVRVGILSDASLTRARRATPVSALADFYLDSDAGSISRIDGVRINEVKAYIESGVLPSKVMDDFRRRLDNSDFVLPNGYQLQFGGEQEERSQAVNALIANAVVLFACMVLTLVVSFRSFRAAAIVMIVGALAVGLGPLALWAFGFPFGFMAIVGTMGLVGVAINDSIVVLAAIQADEQARHGNVK